MVKKNIIIGITGTIGSGKGTIVDFLVNQKGFSHFSVRNFLLKIIKEQGLEANRDTMVFVANKLRLEHEPSYIINCLYEESLKSGKNAIIESIRTPGEVLFLRKKNNFNLIAVNADPLLRYKRIILRNSETDHISFEEFLSNEKREMSSNNENEQNIAVCMSMADFLITNNDSIDELNKKTENILNIIEKN